jgi:hypothetical protein
MNELGGVNVGETIIINQKWALLGSLGVKHVSADTCSTMKEAVDLLSLSLNQSHN